MKYFTELLESYSKLKKRKLKLLSEADDQQQLDPQAKQLADQLIAQAKQSPGVEVPVPNKNGTLITGKEDPNKVFYNGFGAFQIDVSQGEGYSRFVTHLSEGGGEESAPKESPVGEEAIGPITPEMETEAALIDQGVNPDKIREIVEVISNINSLINDIKSANKDALKRLTLGQFIRHLTNSQFVIQRKVGKTEWESVGEYKDPDLMLSVAKNLQGLVELLAKKQATKTDLNALSKFEISGNNIIVKANALEALVFKENGMLTALLGEAKKRFKDQKIKKYSIAKKISAGIDNAFRGTFLEDIRHIATLLAAPRGLKSTLIQKYIKLKYKSVGGKLANLARSTEQWINLHSESSVSEETYILIETFKELAGDKGMSLAKAAMEVAKESTRRGVAFIATKGRVTRHGRRQDTEEVYTSPEKAKEGLLKKGVSEQEIEAKKLIRPTNIRKALEGDTPEQTEMNIKLAKATGHFTEEQLNGTEPVYTGIETLKHYLSIDKEVVFGTTTRNSTDHFTRQDYDKPKISFDKPGDLEASVEFRKKYEQETGQTPEESQKVLQFHEDNWAIWDNMKGLAGVDSLYVKANNGKIVIQKEHFEEFSKKLISLIRGTSNHKDITDESSEEQTIKGKLFATCKRYLDGSEGGENARKRIVAYATMLGTNAKINKGLTSNDPEQQKVARQYLATMLYNTGASVDDSLYADFVGLNSKERFRFFHNDAVMDAVKSIHSGDGRWEIKALSNGFHFVKAGTNPPQYLALTQSTETVRSKEGLTDYSVKTTCGISRNMLVALNRHKVNESVRLLQSNESTVLDAFIESQRNLLETLMLMQKESVWKNKNIRQL